MTYWCSFHELILNWYSATTQKSLFWGQNGPKIPFSSNNSSVTHRNYWKPYINRFLRSISDTLVLFSWIDIKLVFSYNPKILILRPKIGPKPFSSNNSSETQRNYWKPCIHRFLRSIITHWCGFHELILNWYSATTQKSLFWGPKWSQNSIFQ